MAAFTDEFIKTIFDFEGGLSMDQVDSGNYDSKGRLIGSNHGISAQTLEQYYKLRYFCNLSTKPIEYVKDIMKKLSSETAKLIAKTMYWDIIQGDSLTNDSVAKFLFDWFWASGYYGVKWFQGVLKTRLNINVKIDYVFDTFEAKIVNEYKDQGELFSVLKDERLKFTDYIINKSVLNYTVSCNKAKEAHRANNTQGLTNYQLSLFNELVKGIDILSDALVYSRTNRKYEVGWKRRINSYKFEV